MIPDYKPFWQGVYSNPSWGAYFALLSIGLSRELGQVVCGPWLCRVSGIAKSLSPTLLHKGPCSHKVWVWIVSHFLRINKLYNFCSYNEVENEAHFVLGYHVYNSIRDKTPSVYHNIMLGLSPKLSTNWIIGLIFTVVSQRPLHSIIPWKKIV